MQGHMIVFEAAMNCRGELEKRPTVLSALFALHARLECLRTDKSHRIIRM